MAVAFTTEPSGARLPRGNTSVLVRPRARACVGREDDLVGDDAVPLPQELAEAAPPFRLLPPVQVLAERQAGDGEDARVEQAQAPQVQHHLRHAAGQEDPHRGVRHGTVRQDADQPRHAAIDGDPVLHRREREPGRVRDRGNVQQQVGRAAEGGVQHHRVAEAGRGQDVAHGALPARPGRRARGPSAGPCRARPAGPRARAPSAAATGPGPRRPPARSRPCRGTGSRRRATRRRGSPAPRPLRARCVPARSGPRASGSFPRPPRRGGQRDAAGDDHAGKIGQPGHRHHHRRQPLVAGGDAQDALAQGQRSGQPAEDDRGVVPVRQAVEHAGRALRPAVARVGAGPGERDDLQAAQLLRRGLDEQADLPVPGVVAEGDRLSVGGAQPALRAEDEELLATGLRGLPAHAGVLAQAEEVAARAVAQQVLGQGQAPRGAGGARLDRVDLRGARVEDVADGAHARASPACSSSGVTGSRASQQRAPTT